ncbi:MAG TPA: hypothetical protein VH255_03370, partial [Verrucomicrobiae bacterium]|nr:hypothetical protein [Verrucomicrobiae bacterium]
NARTEEPESETLQVIVHAERGRSVGLVVSKIKDIVENGVAAKPGVARNGILRTVVVQEQVTDVLDVAGIVRAAHPSFYQEFQTAANS